MRLLDLQWCQQKSGGLVKVLFWDSGKHAPFVAWQEAVAWAADGVERPVPVESPGKTTKRRESGRGCLWVQCRNKKIREGTPQKKSNEMAKANSIAHINN